MSLRSLLRLFALLAVLFFGVLHWCGAASVIGAPVVAALSPSSVTVNWRTDVPTGTRVKYGLSAERLDQTAEGGLTDAHAVKLGGLQPGARYFFSVGTARKPLATGQFIMSSSPSAASAPPSASRSSSPAASATAPPARATWGYPGSLQDHFDRHGGDFSAKSPEDYAAQAWRFRQRARSGALLVKVDAEGVQRVFDPATGAFAAYNPDGTTKTFFKPGNRDYFNRQPGHPARTVTP